MTSIPVYPILLQVLGYKCWPQAQFYVVLGTKPRYGHTRQALYQVSYIPNPYLFLRQSVQFELCTVLGS